MHPLTLPRADSSTCHLIHLFGTGLAADDWFVVERFRSTCPLIESSQWSSSAWPP